MLAFLCFTAERLLSTQCRAGASQLGAQSANALWCCSCGTIWWWKNKRLKVVLKRGNK